MSCSVAKGVVTLCGYSYQRVKDDAGMAARRTEGVVEVDNKIEELPASGNDDRIRWETYYRIYADDFLSRYAPGGPSTVRWATEDQLRSPGMQPIDNYPIHNIVKKRRKTLVGVAERSADRPVAENA